MHATSKKNVPGIVENGVLVGGNMEKNRGALYLGSTVASLRKDEVLVTVDADELSVMVVAFIELKGTRFLRLVLRR